MILRALTTFALALTFALPAAAQATLSSGEQLRALDAWSVSALARADGALPTSLWRGSDPAFLADTLNRLPSAYDSPAAQALARRVLLSGGDAPAGDGQAAARERFEALGKMGQANELAVMAAGAGASDPLIATYAAQAELARGRRADACARGRAGAGENPPVFLLRLRAYCSAASGDRAAADLALELTHGASPTDAWYAAVIAAIGGAPPARLPQARYDNTLATQLSLAAQLRPGANPLNGASALSLATLARSDAGPQPYRAQAAVSAFRRGALGAEETRAILQATPAEVTAGLPAMATALRQVLAAPRSLQAATAIATLLRQASSAADFLAVSRLFKDDIATLEAAPDQAAAVAFARAALAAGDLALSQRLATSARQAGAAEAVLAPVDTAVAALAGAQGEAGAQAVSRRVSAGGRGAARDLSILAALGAPLDGPALSFMNANPPQGGVRANAATMLALSSAVERGALGEGALLAVLAADGGPARLDAESLDRIIRALRALGLEEDARRFAVEALLAGAPS